MMQSYYIWFVLFYVSPGLLERISIELPRDQIPPMTIDLSQLPCGFINYMNQFLKRFQAVSATMAIPIVIANQESPVMTLLLFLLHPPHKPVLHGVQHPIMYVVGIT